jgi:hypothetical protein
MPFLLTLPSFFPLSSLSLPFFFPGLKKALTVRRFLCMMGMILEDINGKS